MCEKGDPDAIHRTVDDSVSIATVSAGSRWPVGQKRTDPHCQSATAVVLLRKPIATNAKSGKARRPVRA
jgi:hypothetical protein